MPAFSVRYRPTSAAVGSSLRYSRTADSGEALGVISADGDSIGCALISADALAGGDSDGAGAAPRQEAVRSVRHVRSKAASFFVMVFLLPGRNHPFYPRATAGAYR
jgi:hypothetical protein